MVDEAVAAQPRQPLSIVIASRNRPRMLDRCLSLLLRESGASCVNDEVIVIDSASSTDDTRHLAAAYNARYVRVDKAGLSRARNVGWRAASNELVAFVDDDVLVHRDWREAMAMALGEPDVAFVTGWIGLPPSQAHIVEPQPHIVWPERLHFDRTTPRYVGAGANIGVRRSCLEALGGFDERLGAGTFFGAAEDADLFDRLISAGYVGTYRPEVKVDHDAWRSLPERLRQQWAYGKATGAHVRLLLRQDPERVRRMVKRAVWKRGIKLALQRARAGWWGGATASALGVIGQAVGFLAAVPVFRTPWSRRSN
jgi:glycosyltransferase involved in cell wall biosynthesis